MLDWSWPGAAAFALIGHPWPLVVAAAVGIVLMQALHIAQQWERAVVLRLGRFCRCARSANLLGRPFVDRVSARIDQRTTTTGCHR